MTIGAVQRGGLEMEGVAANPGKKKARRRRAPRGAQPRRKRGADGGGGRGAGRRWRELKNCLARGRRREASLCMTGGGTERLKRPRATRRNHSSQETPVVPEALVAVLCSPTGRHKQLLRGKKKRAEVSLFSFLPLLSLLLLVLILE